MLTISKLGMDTARNYFSEEFANASNSYFSTGGSTPGRWRGELARQLGVSGAVTEESYMRLIDGKDPATGEQWIQYRNTAQTRQGKAAAHIPAWDLNMSAPKSFSLAAVVGGDERLLDAMRAANEKAMRVMEGYVQARGGGSRPPINTGRWIIATFQHDTSRPVDGYPAPQVHFHNVLMNVQRDFTGQFRALQSAELYKAKSLGTAVFRSELQRAAAELGYETRVDPVTKAPEIKGFSQEYLEAESLRRQEILERLEKLGMSGGRAAQIAALSSREEKLNLSPDELRNIHRAHGEIYGNQAPKIYAEALERGPVPPKQYVSAEAAVDFAERRLSERQAVFEHFELVRDALRYARGSVDVGAVESEVSRHLKDQRLLQVHHYRNYAPGARYTTPEMVRMEREVIAYVAAGRGSVEPICKNADLSQHPQLADNPQRQEVIRRILSTTDRVVALNGVAGSAKSTSAGIIREIAEAEGYRVKGLAPTGKARDALTEKGIDAQTLQMHLLRTATRNRKQEPTLYILDEATLASTSKLLAFLDTLSLRDHVLLIGDDDANPRKVGQHLSIEAGRIFQELQDAGMKTAHLNKIYRQKDELLKEVVLLFRHSETEKAIERLEAQDRIQEFGNRKQRFAAIAQAYADHPKGTLVVSPDNQSREELNAVIRETMRQRGLVKNTTYDFVTLLPRDTTAADRMLADSYQLGDTLRFLRRDAALDIAAKSYAQVIDADTSLNTITVRTEDGRTLTYNPAQASAVSIFASKIQSLSEGERLQFTANSKKHGFTTRDVGTIKSLDANGNIEVALDKGRTVRWNLRDNRHVDYAYAMTSYSAQGTTVDRVLIHVDASDYRLTGLIDKTMAYVAASRPQYDLQLFTDDASRLSASLSRQNERAVALDPAELRGYRPERQEIASPAMAV
jgi:conjugative relaxase-like TrwC/TraI family protein